VTAGLWWDGEHDEHIRNRSVRYPGAVDIEPASTLEAAADPHRIVRDPDPKSQWGYIRIIGYSASAEAVFTVVVRPGDHAGIIAWPTRGADLRAYRRGGESRSL
jgi:hypothetical protein